MRRLIVSTLLALSAFACGDGSDDGPVTLARAYQHLCDHLEACYPGLECIPGSCESAAASCDQAGIEMLYACGEVDCSTDRLAPLRCRNDEVACFQ